MVPVGRGTRGGALRGAVLAAALAVAVTGCVGGPAADRAASVEGEDANEASGGSNDDEDDEDADTDQDADTGSDPAAEDDAEPEPTPDDPPLPPAEGSVEVDQVIDLEDVSDPWSLAVLPDGDVLVGSRDAATIHRVDADTGESTLLGEIHAAEAEGSGGLLGLAADETYIYAYYTTADDNRIRKYDHKREPLDEGTSVATGFPMGESRNGGALAISSDGFLLASVGDTGEPELAADPDSQAGKILQLDVNRSIVDPEVRSSGHGEVTGLDFDAAGRLWAVGEEGDGRMGLRLIGPVSDDGEPHDEDDPASPVHEWPVADTVSGLAYSAASMWTGATEDGALARVPMDGDEVFAEPQEFGDQPSPVRNVVSGDDGQVWALTGGPGSEELVLFTVS